jgi:hypothetical protein
MTRALFEHDSVRDALASAGLRAEGAGETGPDGPDPVAVFFGWSSLDTLLLRPEFALLSIEGVTFVRLPRGLGELRTYLTGSQYARSDAAEVERLSTSLGQWRWALGRLIDALRRGDAREAGSRLRELRRFDAGHWSGLHERRLQNFGDALARGALETGAVEALLDRAVEMATLEACRPLLPWASGGEKGRRIAPFLDALSYAAQGVGDVAEVEGVARSDEWWGEMESDLARARALLAEVERGGGAVVEVLGEMLPGMNASIKKVREFVASAVGASPDEARDVLAAAEVLARVPYEILRLHARACEALD